MNKRLSLLFVLGVACLSNRATAQTFTHSDVGSPSLAGSATVSGTRITIVGGGHDIWDSSDDFHYYYTAISGPFDVRVRVEDLQGPDSWTKAELMARQDDGTGLPQGPDPQISMMTTRTAGQNEVNIQWRQSRSGPSNWPGTPAVAIRPTYPNTWLRLVRSGDLFIGYSSTNGVNWQKVYEVNTADTANGWAPWPNRINVGLAVTAHNDADPNGATGVFNDLQFATEPMLSATGNGAGFVLKLLETSSALTVATVNQVTLDGSNITAKVTQSRSGTVTTVNYNVVADTGKFFASASLHNLKVVFRDSSAVDHTNTVDFAVAPYVSVSASFAVTGVDTNKAGFRIRPYQTTEAQPNSLSWTEEQLAGLHGTNIADLVGAGADANGFVIDTNMVNFDISGNGSGYFTAANGYGDDPFPGIPGITSSTGNASLEVLTFLQFTAAGLYTMGVNSDDGFHVTCAKNPLERFDAADLGLFDGGRGPADTLFDFAIPQPGFYPFRLIWENGNGELPGNGAGLEWFTVVNGQKILVNDVSNPKATKAFSAGPVGPAFTSSAQPANGLSGVGVTNALQFTLQDADTQVDPATISLTLAGQKVTPVVTKNGTTTTVVYAPPSALASSSNYVASLSWRDNGTPALTHTVQTSFLTERLPSTLPAYQEDPTGLTIMEAENYHGLTPQGGSTWGWLTADAGYSGDGYLQALPNNGVNRGTYPDFLTSSPRLDYKVSFVKTGLHYIWVRGNAISGSDDSIHGGIDGDNPDSARRIDNSFSPNNQWVWVGKINGSNPDTGNQQATIKVPSAGEHVVNFWMREDGLKIDKIILTTDANYVPTGIGPVESRHVGQAPPPSVAISSPTNKTAFPAGANITITATASDVDGTIAKVEFFSGTNKIGEATSAPFSMTWSNVPTGRYVVTAKATDNSGDYGVSGGVKLLVGNLKPLTLLVVGGDPAALNAADAGVKSRMALFGYDVIAVGDTASKTSDADDVDLVITSSTVGSGNVGDKFRLVPVPVLNWEQALQDNYLMTLNTDGVDRGTVNNQTNIIIINQGHPMAAGLSNGTYTVTTSAQAFTWGLPGGDAVIIATLDDGSASACLYGYDKGGTLIDGTTKAPARRAHIFLENNGFAALNATGLKLFDAAASWALNKVLSPSVESRFNSPLLQGANLTLSWSGPGTLQEAPAVTGPWTDSASQSNPQTIPLTGASKFFRIKQ